MRILLIDDDEIILDFLQVCLEKGLPEAVITRYQSDKLGRPGPEFRWSEFDLLLLDYNLGSGEKGTEWLREFSAQPGFPRTLLLTAEDKPRIIGSAVSSGADGYLNKTDLSPALLVSTVKEMFDAHTEAASGVAGAVSAADSEREDGPDAPRFRGDDSLVTGPGGASYRFTRLIGRGGMSRVYLAERSQDGMTAVLKVLDRDVARDPQNVQRFAREGELISQIDSPYVVKIHDHGFTNSYGFIAMEFFGRGDLAQQIRQGISAEDAVLYLHNIACGLEAIHNLGIVHRDLKPGNVMFRGDGSMALVDFGLSKRKGLDASLTATGVVMGTPYCMSPEQTLGMDADARTDLYGAGVIFYEMLTGKRPFTAANIPALLLAIQTEPMPMLPPPLAGYQPLLDRLVAKNPDDRFQSATELIAVLPTYLTPV